MNEEALATVKLFRYDPETDAEPRYVEYKVPYKGYTVKNVLQYIGENLDTTLSFRWGCGKGLCRCCIVSVNDQPCMSCTMPATSYMKIDPHPKFKVLKDIVVDLNEPLY